MPNRLINEQSPYLLQHANNPVNWYPWGNEAFEVAAREHKPLIVSIGYAACHWCHVMEHESFEDEQTAAYMNAHFVCVKVDREEHPDVDHFYMDAVQAIAGNGGWPLNVFVTPDRAPFYGGTYYPPRPAYSRPSWMQLMQRMHEIWTSQYDEVTGQADQILHHLRQASQRTTATAGAQPGPETCRLIADNLLKQADLEKGGFGNAPKFPGTMAISFLLEHYHYTGYAPALQHALHSLDAMMAGGIYDQIGGGFSRYSTDRNWLAPHFEKMLYDNALIVSALCDATRVSANSEYKAVITATLEFVERELKDPAGGYYCALDADSEGVEGKFYTWTWDEWIEALGENDRVAADYFGVRGEGNWEGTNILHRSSTIGQVAATHGISAGEAAARIDAASASLLLARAGRIRPQTDDKCLLSWNALMNVALVKAALCFGNGEEAAQGAGYLECARRHMQWMLSSYCSTSGLLHTWKAGVARIPAKLDDYACLVQAMLQLASATGAEELVSKAAEFTAEIVEKFSADAFFYYTPEGQDDIPVRKVDNYDGAVPSANAMMAANLYTLGMCMEQPAWMDRAERMIGALSDTIVRYSYSFGYWALLLQRHVAGMKTVICAGDSPEAAKKEMETAWLPEAYLFTLRKEISELPILKNKYFAGKMYIFVCSGHTCLSPVSIAAEALQLVNNTIFDLKK